ncbi:MAG: hypothetical protein E7207_04730 [Clostridium butyricum]|nr:hypothetical protein [Clostridium butyricum]
MKKYIFFTGTLSNVGGGQIYTRNKKNFLEENGYEVYIFYAIEGKRYIREFLNINNYYPELSYYPAYFNKKKIEGILDKMKLKLNIKNGDEIIIESHTYICACWAELLASKTKGKHFAFLLQENFNIKNNDVLEFFYFKLLRKELAGISKDSLPILFKNLINLNKDQCYHLEAVCENSVEDIDTDICKKIDFAADYHICTVGRLEKIYVKTMLEGVAEFCNIHKDKKVQLFLIGGTMDNNRFNKVLKIVKDISNLDIYVSGFIYPIPRKIFKYMDAAIATAGSVLTCSNEGVTTISMNVVSGMPIGIYNYNTVEDSYSNENNNFTVCGLLEKILIDGVNQRIISSIVDEENQHNIEFQEQLKFLKESLNDKIYFDTSELCESNIKKRIFRILKLKIINYLKREKIYIGAGYE